MTGAVTTTAIGGAPWAIRDAGAGRPLLLLHGFTGSGGAWDDHLDELTPRWRVVAPDLPGHGGSWSAPEAPNGHDPATGVDAASTAPERFTVERTADDLAALLRQLDASPADVLGYSLGARIALRLAIAHPEAVSRLVLESPSAGLETEAERESRRAADAALAARIERDGIEAFVDAWERMPVFASQAAAPLSSAGRLRAIRLANDPAGLAASLRAAGQGAMEPLFDRLASVAAPTLVVTGALDEIGRPRAERVARGIPAARLAVVQDAGHTPHDEQPEAFRRLVLDFLQEVPAA